MLFLKQLRAHGFKSFADPIVLDFSHNMIGIVGPNGSGKSNITDAIRWALGEQSTKSLRGSTLDDIVFSGNPSHNSGDFAKVTLVFDNSNRTFKSLPDNIVEITRRFNKKTRESDFYVNNNRVRLREIQELALETGLTKSSIAIISQGTVSQFAEAKPQDRRDIFDEAAGMAKYKKRKREAQLKLIQARENYNRLNDLTSEIGARLPNLKRQAEKAKTYQEKIAALKEYELAILTLDIHNFQNQIENLNQNLTSKNIEANQLDHELEVSQTELNQIFEETKLSTNELNDLNQSFQDVLSDLTQAIGQQKDLEAREQRLVDNKNIDDFKAQDIKRRYQNLILEIKSKEQKHRDLSEAIAESEKRFNHLNDEYNQKNLIVSNLNRRLYQANFDYQQFQTNHNQTHTIFSPALKTIISNQKYLEGIIGPLLQLIQVDSRYQIALSTGATNSLLSVVTTDTNAAKRGIDFLKQNQNGRVTFLPLETLTPSRISGSIRDFITQQPGFIGFGNELAKIKPSYSIALDYALASLIVVQDYNSAVQMSKTTNQRFNIVTLDGDKFLPKGAIVGGHYRNQNLFANLETENNWAQNQLIKIKDFEKEEKTQTEELNNLRTQKDRARDDVNNFQNQFEQLKLDQKQMQKNLQFIDEEYHFLTGMNLNQEISESDSQSPTLKIDRKINELKTKRDELQKEINRLNLIKTKNLSRQEELNNFNQTAQKKLMLLQKEINQAEVTKSRLETLRDSHLQTLTRKYQLTLDKILASPKPELPDEENARKLIQNLTNEISSLGNINLEAIDEYDAEQKRFDYYQTQLQDIITSINQMEEIIEEIDREMKQQFHQIVLDVNRVLPEVFQKLFGGGHAQLIFDQPDNLLETGIDIKVNPPGKKIINLNLLSGGEKSLVALSVLFSLLRVRPLPLVILDEAEAPLDAANVERFSLYIKEFTDATQFLIVTHREGTMENCDVLFGVTMQTPGITKMVKIQLLDAKTYLDLPKPI